MKKIIKVVNYRSGRRSTIFHVSILEPFHKFTIPRRHIRPPPTIKMDDLNKNLKLMKFWIHKFFVNVWNT
jgi:hypothetical protein